MEKPILFNNQMVKAIVEGRKTVTRRLAKNIEKPPFSVGDVLYVRETWQDDTIYTHADIATKYYYRADGETQPTWRPSIHMPKKAARIWLKVTSVSLERLQDITADEVRKEGAVDSCCMCSFNKGYKTHEIDCSKGISRVADCELDKMFPDTGFSGLWDSTLSKDDLERYGWNANPWVWVISFEVAENKTL